jgi:hypothetical protein
VFFLNFVSLGRCKGGLILLFCVIVVYGETKDNSRLFGTLIYIYIYVCIYYEDSFVFIILVLLYIYIYIYLIRK